MMKNTEKVMRYFVIGEDVAKKVEYCDFGIVETPVAKTENTTVRTQNNARTNLGNIFNDMSKKGIVIVEN